MKAEIRKSAIHDVGMRLDDLLESTRAEIARADGRISAFGEASRVPTALVAALRRDIDEGKIDLAVSDVVSQWLVKTTAAIENMQKNAAMEKVAAAGKVAGLRAAVDAAKVLHDAEDAKQRVVSDLAAGVEREVQHKAPVKLRRLAEQRTADVEEPKRKGKRRAKNT